MDMTLNRPSSFVLATVLGLSFSLGSFGQATNTNRTARSTGPRVVSPEVSADRKITFRILAPKAEKVRLGAGDIQALPQGGPELEKGTNGVWELTVGPIQPGAYRYNFNIDGATAIDPRNPSTSESNENTWSLVYVPGEEYMDTKDVPHGALSEVTYYSSVLKRFRRLHVYTPPGYETDREKYPIFYLLHGASDSDDSWSSVGRAGFILDNLIAAKKAKPMVVVMPHGRTGPSAPGGRSRNEFEKEFATDIMPFVEKRYRVLTDRANRALAGLSMGGAQTLNIGFSNLQNFSYLGVFSSGVFGIAGDRGARQSNEPPWEERNKEALVDAKLKEGLKLVWFATGKDDFLLRTSQATVEMLKKHKFDVVYKESEGAHTWIVWREYLKEFAPLLFQ
jgi:enterochelin esterase-like enzyme